MDDRRKSRRSSILKPPKPRNPLSDVHLNPPSVVDATFMKSRRVSFANSNFIKEFTADPEKNTIWHNSYEEKVNKSEDSKNNEHPSISVFVEQDDFNCTRVEIDDNSLETPLLNSPLETSICSANIDLTTQTNDDDAAANNPVIYVSHPVDEFHEITPTPTSSQYNNCSIFNYNQNFDQLFQNSKGNMEITGSIPANSNLMKNILKSKSKKFGDPLFIINKENEPFSIVNNQVQGCNDEMELTQANIHFGNIRSNFPPMQTITIPTTTTTTTVEDENNITLQVNKSLENSLSVSDVCSMDITQTISTSITTASPFPRTTQETEDNDDDMETTEVINTISDNFKENDMEFTAAITIPIGIHQKQHISANIKIENLKLISVEDNMEMTEAIPCGLKIFSNTNINTNTNINNNSKKNEMNEDNMEMTEAIPFKIISNNENIEEMNMELTQAIPGGIKLINDMEMTTALPSILKLMTHMEDNINMEMTQVIPDRNNMELTTSTDTFDDEKHFINKSMEEEANKSEEITNTFDEFTDVAISKKQTTITSEERIHNISINDTNKENNEKIELTPITIDDNVETEISSTIINEKVNDSTATINTSKSMKQPFPIGNFANIFHLKEYPLILSPEHTTLASNDANKSDICLRIKYAGDESSSNVNGSQIEIGVDMNLTSKSNCSLLNNENEKQESSLYIDSTEKLINYQIKSLQSLNESNIKKRLSSENICNMSNISIKKIVSETSSPNDDDDDNVAWRSMVEKSFISTDVLSSENVSLVVDSFDSGPAQAQVQVLPENTNLLSLSDFFDKIIQKLSNSIEIETTTTPDKMIKDDSMKNEKCDRFRKRFEESFKKEKKSQIIVEDLSLEEKIIQKSKDALWNIVELNDSIYTFNFMFETIEFIVYTTKNTENVEKIEFYSQFCEEKCHPAALYVHNILQMKKLTRNYIVSALGSPYTVLSLLDLITIMGEQMLDIINEFDELECRHGLVLNKDFMVQMTFYDLHLAIAFETTLNISNLENMTKDDVIVNVIVGQIDENAIKKLIVGCPQGIQLLRTFIDNVEGYIKFLKSIKRKN